MKKNTTKQPKLAEDSIIASLKAKFRVGEVPKAEDFGDLIELSAQVRAVDSSGLDLNDVTGELSVNYGTVSETLAGSVADTGLTGTGNTLVVDYGIVSTKLAGTAADTGLTGTGNTLVVDYGTVSTKLAGTAADTGLTGTGNTLVVDYGTVSTKLAGKGLTSLSNKLDVNYDEIIKNITDKVWMKMMAKLHNATHYVEHHDFVVFLRSVESAGAPHTRAYFYTLTSRFMGVDSTNVTLGGDRATRFNGEFDDWHGWDHITVAEWRRPIIGLGPLKVVMVSPSYKYVTIERNLKLINEL